MYGLPQIKTSLQRLRCILGICSLIREACINPVLWNIVSFADTAYLVQCCIQYSTDNYFGLLDSEEDEDDVDLLQYVDEDEVTNIPPEEMSRLDEHEDDREDYDGPVLIELG